MSIAQLLHHHLRGSLQQHLVALLAAAGLPTVASQAGLALDRLQLQHHLPTHSNQWPAQQRLLASQCRALHSHAAMHATNTTGLLIAACHEPSLSSRAPPTMLSLQAWPGQSMGSTWQHMQALHRQQVRHSGNLSRVRVPKSAAINQTPMGNKTQLQYGVYGIRALTGQRVAANTIEAMRRTLRRKLKKSAALWVRIQATVPVTRKPLGIRMGKGKGHIEFYATAVRPGQIICEMDRVPRTVALAALEALQPKFPCRLGFVEWN